MSTSMPFGIKQLTLRCGDDKSLQGWNQADNYLLNTYQNLDDKRPAACINDSFGALHLSLDNSVSYTDSAVTRRWTQINAGHNALTHVHCEDISALAHSNAAVFLMRLPKNLHYFQYLLSVLAQKGDVTVLVAGMQKHWPSTFYKTAYDFFDEVEVLPGIKKAKCMVLKKGKKHTLVNACQELSFSEFDLQCRNYPNVFAREKLDIGTRFFLENLPDMSQHQCFIDLACGNGLLGIQALKKYPKLQGIFVDESAFAIRSAEESLLLNGIDHTRVQLQQADVLHGVDTPCVDAVLCNPPFHQQHSVTTHISEAMITASAKALKKGGSLYLVANKHLPYKALLNRNFSSTKVASSNSKFVIYQSIK